MKSKFSRSDFLKWGLIAVTTVIIGRLFFIQIIEHEAWTEKAAAQQTMQNVLKAERGEIYMMNGDETSAVALNATVYTVIVDPKIADSEKVAVLSEILGEAQIATWEEVFADPELRYYIVAKDIERPIAEKIAEADLTGVWLENKTKRIYPEGTLGSTVLGFVNADGLGQYGIEGAMNSVLAGKDGLLKTVKDVNNIALSIGDDNVKIPAEDGADVVLSVDKNLQNKVEKELVWQTGQSGFKNISAVVMNPQNGKVLAMANVPGYDPADYGNVSSAEDYINHVVEDAYEPASVCKTFTFAAGIDQGVVTPEKTYVNEGLTTVDGWPIKNAAQDAFLLGTQTIQTGFNYSLNTSSTQALRWLGGSETDINQKARETLYDYYHNRFGLGMYTGIELIESAGIVHEPNADIYGIDSTYANMTFGQNMQVTMIQVAAAFSSIVNGGYYYTPTMIEGVLKDGKLLSGYFKDGEFTESADTTAVRTTVSPSTSLMMREMLQGTRRSWRNSGFDQPGFEVGGKTGTAQVIRNGEYVFSETVATYIGYGGTAGEMPEYVIMVRVWEDGKKATGEGSALPVFNALKTITQDYLRIRPAN